MKSKISFFNAGLFKSNLRRFWPLWAAHFLIWLVCMPLLLLMGRMEGALYPSAVFETVQSCLYFAPYAAAIMALLSAMAVFGFMYTSRSTGLIASLPVRREAVFSSACLGALAPVLASNLVVALLTFLFALTGSASPSMIFKVVATWLAVYSMEFVLFFGMAAICAVMTGSSVFLPILYIVANFLVYGIEICARTYMSELVWGLSYDSETMFDIFSPLVFLADSTGAHLEYEITAIESTVTSFRFNGWLPVIIYFAVGLLFAIAALLVFRKRRMESAGEFIAVHTLRPVFKYGVAACAAFAGGLVLYEMFSLWLEDAPALLIMLPSMFVCGFIGCYGAEMLIKKSFHVFKKGWLGFIVLCCCCVIFVLCCDLDVLGAGKYVPDAGDIKSVNFDYGGEDLKNEKTVGELVELNKQIVEKRDEYKDLSYAADNTTIIQLSYTLKNGRQLSRSYIVPEESEAYKTYVEIISSKEVMLEQLTPPMPVDVQHCDGGSVYVYTEEGSTWELTPKDALDLYENALLKDIENGATGLVFGDASSVAYAHADIGFMQYINQEDFDYYYVSFDITDECTACIEWIKEHLGVDLTTIYEADNNAG